MKNLFCFLVLIVVSSTAVSANWKYAATSATNHDFYIDTTSIKKSNSLVRVWIKTQRRTEDSQTQPESYFEAKINELSRDTEIQTTRSFMEYNCKSRQFRILSTSTLYASNRALSNDYPNNSWKHIPPDSMMESIYDRVCK